MEEYEIIYFQDNEVKTRVICQESEKEAIGEFFMMEYEINSFVKIAILNVQKLKS